MNAGIVKKHLREFSHHFPGNYPATGWFFSSTIAEGAITFDTESWSCMFEHAAKVSEGKTLCFSKNAPGCSGAACYLGFKEPSVNAGIFLAEKEKFKENAEFGRKFYEQIVAKKAKAPYLLFGRLEDIEDERDIEVVNCWVSPLILSGLVTLANFDRPTNDNVSIPFASGCQSLWTIPYQEKNRDNQRATIGALDPAMRHHLSADTLVFSVPAQRFAELATIIPKSFASMESWQKLINSIATLAHY